MKRLMLSLALILGMVAAGAVSHPAVGIASAATASIQQPAPDAPKLDVDVNVDRGQHRWIVSPIWLAIGGLALLVLIALVVSASRGREGGTTVVRG